MSDEHNPIAQLIAQLQQKWIKEVSPHDHINLVRWLVRPEHAKLYTGFLQVESSNTGRLPEMVLVLLTIFKDAKEHSKNLILEWINSYRGNAELIEKYKKNNKDFHWDADYFEKRVSDDHQANNLLLIELLSSFQGAHSRGEIPLVLCLYPYGTEDMKAYNKWLDTILKLGLPPKIRLMIFDNADDRYFDKLCDAHAGISKTLAVPFDLSEAISKLAKAGDPNDPVVQFRECMLKMGKAVRNQNLLELNKWGEKGIEIMQKTGDVGMFSNSHIVYAGMLFNFKEYDAIDELLSKGLLLAKKGLKAKNVICKTLIIQYYAFQASSKQLQKKFEEATDLFCMQADTAIEIGFPQQSLNAWWMAYNAIKKLDRDRYSKIVRKAYEKGVEQDKETLKSTTMSFIAADYYNILDKRRRREDCQEVDAFMVEVEGEKWREDVESRRKAMEKRKYTISNWF
ncbi:hypothetical protein [Pareuzebyella sediminis]|uniref:hypothetical protein n=1 Tax=Pareuzebyella sediminis TaxID=2607998 RepID=UPI0011EDDE73|nr:hypothetical protein [Pareuzebyella sediminis]